MGHFCAGETLEDVAFLSGAALATLHLVAVRGDVPHALMRARLALYAAEACVVHSGRSERAGALRDEVHLLRPGDLPGPAGDIYQCWQRAVQRPVSTKALHRALPDHAPEQLATWLDAETGAPITRAAQILEAVLTDSPRSEVPALVLADAALAQALGWDHLMPLLVSGLKRGDLRKRGDELRLACHRAVRISAERVVHVATDLTRKTERLNAVAPKLRAKGAAAAVQMFLTRDAMTPAGRDTFRLYGV